jgi:hypothetical protein
MDSTGGTNCPQCLYAGVDQALESMFTHRLAGSSARHKSRPGKHSSTIRSGGNWSTKFEAQLERNHSVRPRLNGLKTRHGDFLTTKLMAAATGLEPAASCVTGSP